MIHQIWLGGKPMPEEFARYAATWREHFPDWEYRLWGERDDYSWMTNRERFAVAPTQSERSDWLRYELMLTFGGIYADTDFECLRNFERLLAGLDAFAASEDGRVISVGLIGSAPGHPAYRYAVEHQPEWDDAHQTRDAALRSGPGFFTAIHAQYVANGGAPLKVFPPALFYPYHFTERHRKKGPFPHAYAVHHWAASWMPATSRARSGAPRRHGSSDG